MNQDLDEQELARRCSKGDRLAEDELYRRYAARLFALCRRYTENPDDAKDLMQEALIRALDKIADYRFMGPGSLYGWISRIAINMALNWIKRRRFKTVSIDGWSQDTIPDPEQEDMTAIPQEKLLEWISSLPDVRRAIFNLYCIDGYSHKEIGKMLGITEKSSASALAKARNQLKKSINNYSSNKSNKNDNINNNNDNSPNILMDSNKNDISEIIYDNIPSKDIMNSKDNLDTVTSHKKSIDKNTISHISSVNNTDSRKSTTTKIKKTNDKIINKNKIHNFINNINNERSKNNVPFNPHNTLRSENETTNKDNSTNDDRKNKTSKNNNNDKIINNKKIIENDIILDSVNNARSKESNNNNDYDDINCNFNINNYLNENSLREKKENIIKQKDKIKLDKLTEKIISGKIINKKSNDKFIGINNNIKNKKMDKYLDKKNIEQLLLNKEKLVEYNKKIVSKKLNQLNKAQQSGINKIPKMNVKPAKKSTHNRNVDPNNFILNNRTNTSVLSTMKDSNYYSHECEILSKNIKEYYKQNLCYPNTDLNFYKYGRVIGRGAFGKVNIGLNILTGRIVAIKSFNKKNLVSESAKNKILYETNLMRGLYHPSVTKILETFECEKYMLIIMEYISGGNLQNFVKKRRKL